MKKKDEQVKEKSLNVVDERSQAREKNGSVAPSSYLDTIDSATSAKKATLKKYRRGQRRKRVVAAALAFAFIAALVLGSVNAGIMDSSVKLGGFEVDLKNVGYSLGLTAAALDPASFTLNDYESEIEQFLYNIDEELLVEIPGYGFTEEEKREAEEQEKQRQAVILSEKAVESDAPMVDEEEKTIGDANDAAATPVIMINGVPVCAVALREDAEWIRKSLLDKYTHPVAGGKMTKRGFVDDFEIMFTTEPQENVMDRNEAYLMLLDRVSVRLREELEAVQTVPYKTIYEDDSTLEKGKKVVKTEGQDGEATAVYEVVSINGVESERNIVGEPNVTRPAVDKIVLRGTKIVATPKPTEKPKAVDIPQESSSAQAYSGSRSTYGSETPGSYSSIPLPDKSYAFSGSDVGSGKYYPNIDTTARRPGKDQGIAGPSPGGLSFGWPVKGYGKSGITSYFGWRFGRMHYGNDTFAPTGTSIVASESGTVTSYTGEHNGYGLIVEIKHSNGFTTRYAHCDSLLVEEGQSVSKGDVIATVGATGTSDKKAHCHFEIRCGGVPYNPLFYM